MKPSPHYKGFSVEIRPPRWKKKIWIGKLETLERAKYIADAVRHYLGMPPFHFEEGVMSLPVITCIGTVIGTPVRLSTQEMCASYVREIAKGEVFQPQRDDFILKVKKVVKNPDFLLLVSSQTEQAGHYERSCDWNRGVVLRDEDDRDQEDEFCARFFALWLQPRDVGTVNGTSVRLSPQEMCASYVREIAKGVTFQPQRGDCKRQVENVDMNPGFPFLTPPRTNEDDCPTSYSEAEKIWIECIEELDKSPAVGASTPSVASNDAEVCRDGCETSPVLNIPWSIVRPSSQFCENAKRQKIGD